MNNVTLMGRLTADAELRQTQNGLAVTRFTVAVNRKYAKEGQQQADFISCIAWRHTAEFISKYFRKGNMIAVTGSIQTGSYEKDGRKVYTTDVLVENAYFTGGKNEATQTQQQPNNNDGFNAFTPAPLPQNEDDLPF